jgi:hypothetical protein
MNEQNPKTERDQKPGSENLSEPEQKAGQNPQVGQEADNSTHGLDAGVPGQIQYPDAEINAERAAAYAGGKEDTLFDDDDTDGTWVNPADNRSEEQVERNETEPEEMRHESPEQKEEAKSSDSDQKAGQKSKVSK